MQYNEIVTCKAVHRLRCILCQHPAAARELTLACWTRAKSVTWVFMKQLKTNTLHLIFKKVFLLCTVKPFHNDRTKTPFQGQWEICFKIIPISYQFKNHPRKNLNTATHNKRGHLTILFHHLINWISESVHACMRSHTHKYTHTCHVPVNVFGC